MLTCVNKEIKRVDDQKRAQYYTSPQPASLTAYAVTDSLEWMKWFGQGWINTLYFVFSLGSSAHKISNCKQGYNPNNNTSLVFENSFIQFLIDPITVFVYNNLQVENSCVPYRQYDAAEHHLLRLKCMFFKDFFCVIGQLLTWKGGERERWNNMQHRAAGQNQTSNHCIEN